MSLVLGTSFVFTIVMLVSLCEVGDEMELLLELCNRMPSIWSIVYPQPNCNSGCKTIMGNFDSNVSALYFYWIKPYTMVTTPKSIDLSTTYPI
jgi:hypothetical protein